MSSNTRAVRVSSKLLDELNFIREEIRRREKIEKIYFTQVADIAAEKLKLIRLNHKPLKGSKKREDIYEWI